MEDPKQAKGIVKREVIRVVTPGTVIESNLLDEKKNNYIMSVYKSGIYFGIAVCDVSTGDFRATQIKETNNFSAALDEISRYSPAEIVVNNLMYDTTEEIAKIRERFQIYISKQEDNKFSNNVEELTSKYNVVDESENKIEINDKTLCICAINGLLTYILETQKTNLDHINKIILYNNTKYMCLDINARRNLELTEKLRDKSKKGTLLWVLDKTSTSMGGRRLRRWINDPLLDIEKINKRLNSVKELKDNPILRGDIADLLKKVYDIERLVGKISYGNANARDLISLKNSVKQLTGEEVQLWEANFGYSQNTHIIGINQPLGQMYGYITEGLYQVSDFDYDATTQTYTLKDGIPYAGDKANVKPGMWKFKNVDGSEDNKITEEDKTVIGNAYPKFYGGINNTFTYKDFDLSIFLTYSFGNDVLNATKLTNTKTALQNKNVLAAADSHNRWVLVNKSGELITDPQEMAEINSCLLYTSDAADEL